MSENIAGIIQVILFCIVGLAGIAFWSGAIIAIWMLILGKFHRPLKCPKCGADLRTPNARKQPFSNQT
jgi:hypothetical protein